MRLLQPYADLAYAKELTDAVREEGEQRFAFPYALTVKQQIFARGETEKAIELVDAVRARFPKQREFLPHLLYERADLCRDLYRFDEALRDLDAADDALPPAPDPMLVFYMKAVRMQVYLDLGLLDLAFDVHRSAQASARAALSAGEGAAADPENRRLLLLNPSLFHYAIEIGRRNYADAVADITGLLEDEELFPTRANEAQVPRMDALGLHVMRGIAAGPLARDQAALGHPERAEVARSTARADLDLALGRDLRRTIESGALTAEEVRKGLLAQADLAWLEQDRDRESLAFDQLDELLADATLSTNPEDVARFAAFRVRRHVADAEAAAHDVKEAEAAVAAAVGTPSEPAPDSAAPAEEPNRLAGAVVRLVWSRFRFAVLRGRLADDPARLEAAYADIESAWLAVPRPPEGLGFLHGDTSVLVLSTWLDVLLARDPDEGPRKALHVLARAQAAATLAQRLGGGERLLAESAARAEAYLAELPEGAGVLVFLPSLDASYVLAADAEGVLARPIAPRCVLEKLAADLMREVGSPPPAEAARRKNRAIRIAVRSTALAGALFPSGVADRVASWDRVAFVGAELFGRPALEDLSLGDGLLDGRPLGETHATVYLPGLALGNVLAGRWPEPVAEPVVSLIAGPERGDSLALELEDDLRRELEGLVGVPRLRTGPAASLGAPDDEDFEDVSALVFLAHGTRDASLRRPALVALTPSKEHPDGMLTCAELEAFYPDLPPLVLFLTCRSAAGPTAAGDAGIADLGGAALLGGALAALVATSDVSLDAARIILETVIRRTRAGDPPDEALRRARIEVARTPELDDPFYTGALRLFGVAHLPLAVRQPALDKR